MTALSIIIPVFETPLHLVKNSVESAVSVCESELEVLVADDGNEKPYADALDAIAVQYNCIRVLHLPHKGVSATRNSAVSEAKGVYITFLDADDVLHPEAVREVLALCNSRKPDLLITRITRRQGTGGNQAAVLEDSEALRRDLRVYYTTLHDRHFRNAEAWVNRGPVARFVKRELARNCPMKEALAFGEDVIWNFELLKRTEHLLVTAHVTYCYTEHSTSATQRVREQFPEEVRKLLGYYKREMAGWPRSDRVYFYVAAIEYFTIMMRLYVFAGDKSNARSRFREVFSDSLWQKVFRRCRLSTLRGRYLLTGLAGKFGKGEMLYLLGFVYDRMIRKRAGEVAPS